MIVNKKSRINLGSFDLVKGVAMLLVVISHTIGRYSGQSVALQTVQIWASRLAIGIMPMFFIISGYAFKEKPLKKMLKKSFSDLVVPYLWVMAAYGLLFPIVTYSVYGSLRASAGRAAQFVAAFLLGWTRNGEVLLGYEVAWCTATWYFLASFVAFNVLNLILKLKNQAAQAGCVVLCFVLSCLLFDHGIVFYCIPQGLQAVGFCYIGYLIKKYNLFDKLMYSPWTYVILIPIYLMQAKWGDYDMSMGNSSNMLLNYIGAGCCGVLCVFVGIYAGKCEWRVCEWIKKIGVYTYWIIAIHAAEMEMFPWYMLPMKWPDTPVLAFAIELCCKILIIVPGCWLLKRISQMKYRKKLAGRGK